MGEVMRALGFVATQMGVHPGAAVMPVVVVIQVRVHQRRRQSSQLKGDRGRDRDNRSQHPDIVRESGCAVKQLPGA